MATIRFDNIKSLEKGLSTIIETARNRAYQCSARERVSCTFKGPKDAGHVLCDVSPDTLEQLNKANLKYTLVSPEGKKEGEGNSSRETATP